MTLDEVINEPLKLQQELCHIQSREEDLAMRNYRAFITASEALESLNRPIAGFAEALDKVSSESLPQLDSQMTTVAEKISNLAKAQERNQLTLQRQNALFELVELPLIMEGFVQRGAHNLDAYEHALAVHAYTLQLGSLYPDLPLVRQLVEAVQSSALVLSAELQQLLRSPIQLAVCLRVVGFLRRLRLVDEPALRSTFLACRDAYLSHLLASIDQAAGSYAVAGKLIDISRGALFDIVTQYRAIFIDDLASSAALHGWVSSKIDQFCHALRRLLEDLTEGSHLSSLLDQSMYFAMSLGRVGADFRPMLVPMFVDAASKLLSSGIGHSVHRLLLALPQYAWAKQSKLLSYYSGRPSHSPYDPPTVLLQYPPLAAFCNDSLATLNQFRHCAVFQLEAFSRQFLADSLARVLTAVEELEPSGFSSPGMHAQLVDTVTQVLNPFLLRALTRIWEGDAIEESPSRAIASESPPPPPIVESSSPDMLSIDFSSTTKTDLSSTTTDLPMQPVDPISPSPTPDLATPKEDPDISSILEL
ncbi:MAG: hypothetical protein Q8P67_18400 [archaeon]|nr:hypothetical protein [archaeon]